MARADGKRRGGSGKGNPFERWLCDRLSLWWLGRPGRRVFWRTSGSGATATVRGRKGLHANHCGDLCSIDPCSAAFCQLLVVECKRGYNGATVQDLLDKPANRVYEGWFQQAEEACRNADAFSWLLVVKRDQREPVVFYPRELGAEIAARFRPIIPIWQTLVFRDEKTETVATTLETFLAHVTPEHIKRLAEELTW